MDEREKASGIPRKISKMGILIDYRVLPIGDYILSEEVAIERKSSRDLLASIYDGRLFGQLSQLASHYPKPFLLIEGDITTALSEMRNPNVFYGALASISLSLPISVLFAANKEQTARIIYALASHKGREEHPRPVVRGRKQSRNISDEQVAILSSFPGVGITIAKRLLAKFGSPSDVVRAQVQELANVPGIGPSRASKLKKILTLRSKTESQEGYQRKLESN
ncbi:MAG: ERCC4 domain-containing protein [Nitrososphaerales archaeon]